MRQLPAIEAQRQLNAVHAACAPHYTVGQLRSYIRSLERQARRGEASEPQGYKHIRKDPAAAAEWFAAQGVRVVKTG